MYCSEIPLILTSGRVNEKYYRIKCMKCIFYPIFSVPFSYLSLPKILKLCFKIINLTLFHNDLLLYLIFRLASRLDDTLVIMTKEPAGRIFFDGLRIGGKRSVKKTHLSKSFKLKQGK